MVVVGDAEAFPPVFAGCRSEFPSAGWLRCWTAWRSACTRS